MKHLNRSMGNSEEGEGQSFRIEILDQFQLVFFPCAPKGKEIADHPGADEFFPFLLKADLGKRQWFRLAIQSTDGPGRFHCIRIESFLM